MLEKEKEDAERILRSVQKLRNLSRKNKKTVVS
jgi:hypothetical protein